MSKIWREDTNQGQATVHDVSGGYCGEVPDAAAKLILTEPYHTE